MQPHVFVGLGNVGPRFSNTRHNLGIATLKSWVETIQDTEPTWQPEPRFSAELSKVSVDGKKIVALFPTTMMNDSGQAVQQYLTYHNLTPADVLIIHEDIELPLGEVKLTYEGSAKGHNGVRSIQAELKTNDIPRLRLGVGRPPADIATRDFVLSPFSIDDMPARDQLIRKATATLTEIATTSAE